MIPFQKSKRLLIFKIIFLLNFSCFYPSFCNTTIGLNDTTLANYLLKKGDSIADAGDCRSAIPLYLSSLKIFKNASSWEKLVKSYTELGWCYMQESRYDVALESLKAGLVFGKKFLGDNHDQVLSNLSNTAALYRIMGDFDHSIQLYALIMDKDIKKYGYFHLLVAADYNNIGLTYSDMSDFDLAIRYFEQAIRIAIPILGESNVKIAFAFNNIGNAYLHKRELIKALENYNKSIEIFLNVFHESNINFSATYDNMGLAYRLLQEYDLSMVYAEKAFQLRSSNLHPHHHDLALSYEHLSTIYSKTGSDSLSLHFAKKALEIAIYNFGNFHPLIGKLNINMSTIFYEKAIRDGFYNDIDEALLYIQMALKAFSENYNIENIYTHPGITNKIISNTFLEALEAKALVLYKKWEWK